MIKKFRLLWVLSILLILLVPITQADTGIYTGTISNDEPYTVYPIRVSESGKTLAVDLQSLCPYGLELTEIRSVRGDKVWPDESRAFGSDYLTARFMFEDAAADQSQKMTDVANLTMALSDKNIREMTMLTTSADCKTLNFR